MPTPQLSRSVSQRARRCGLYDFIGDLKLCCGVMEQLIWPSEHGGLVTTVAKAPVATRPAAFAAQLAQWIPWSMSVAR